ncbi:MAG: cyclic nucleotide-binding/CBS domain-containing protein [Chloroflexi bacterium]|nr:MAG: cyclic nucleotide-binding/CBS domain-containing protein [Chloroflexota bacterium]
MDIVRTYPPFTYLNDEEWTRLQQSIILQRVPAGTVILQQEGPPSQYLYVIRQGAVRFVRQNQPVLLLEEGDFFGYPSLLSGKSPTVNVIADEVTELYCIPKPVFFDLVQNSRFAEFFLKGLSERLRHQADSRTPAYLVGDMTAAVETLVTRPPLFVGVNATVGQAAQVMRSAWVSSVLVQSDPPGILTDRDLRNRVLAEQLGPNTPVTQVMSCPLKSVPADTPISGALLFMLEENIHHLPLTRQGEIIGVVTDTDLLRHQARTPLYLFKHLQQAPTPEILTRYALDIAGTVEMLYQGGLSLDKIGQVVASLNDTLLRRLLKQAEEALGPPPTPYAWLVFGSEGRMEQLLLTDQDNALVYQDDTPEAKQYFTTLAGQVVDQLLQAGFPPCPGGYMATNWCKPLPEWVDLFQRWVNTPNPDALLQTAIFFDFRPVFGALSVQPLENIIASSGRQRIFLAHLAQAAVKFRPPLGFFRRIRDEEGRVDLKMGGIAPVVSLARVYALEAGVTSRATLTRLDEAAQAGTLSREGAETLAETFRFLLRLRLQAQLQQVQAGQQPTNQVHLDSISPLERRHLKDSFSAIREMQEAVAHRFNTTMLG